MASSVRGCIMAALARNDSQSLLPIALSPPSDVEVRGLQTHRVEENVTSTCSAFKVGLWKLCKIFMNANWNLGTITGASHLYNVTNCGRIINKTKLKIQNKVLVDNGPILCILCGIKRHKIKLITIWQYSFYVAWLITTHYHCIINLMLKELINAKKSC